MLILLLYTWGGYQCRRAVFSAQVLISFPLQEKQETHSRDTFTHDVVSVNDVCNLLC
jgi:hypothetical protein